MNPDIIKLLKCPISNQSLIFDKGYLLSENNEFKYKIDEGIKKLIENIDNKNTSAVREFYMEDPFPNYNSFDNLDNFIEKMSSNNYIQSILKLINPNDKILEFGCGTGQLGNYLSAMSYANIVGADLTINSLKMANNFRKKNSLKGIEFIETDIFKPCFKDKSFDMVICSGVLHHTINPYLGFQNLLKYVKDDGYIIIGLYNKISRFKNSLIKFLSYFIGKFAFQIFDPVYKKKDDNSKLSWLKDQYYHPLEKRYSFEDLHKWYKENDIKFLNSIPSYNKNYSFDEKVSQGDKTDEYNVQIIDFLENNEGGLFLFLGKKTKK